MVMDRDGQPLGPSGRLANRIRDHVAAAKELLRQSHQVVERAGTHVRQSQLRLERAGPRTLRAGEAPLTPLADRILRILEVKQRELTAHRGAIELHEEAAQLQERLGHPDRAAEARQHAAHARELYREAWGELADYQSRRGSGRP